MLVTPKPASEGNSVARHPEISERRISRRSRGTYLLRSRPSHRIVLVDETHMTRDCLEHFLTCQRPEFIVSAVPKVSDAPAGDAHLVLLSIKSARLTDVWVRSQIAEIAHRYNDVPIVVLTDYDDSGLAAETVNLHNLRGHIPASLSAEIAVAALPLIIAGGTFFPAQLAPPKTASHEVAAVGNDVHSPSLDNVGLTQREGEILKLLSEGKPNKLIAYDLKISESTVKAHLRHIMAKLHVSNRTAAALHALA